MGSKAKDKKNKEEVQSLFIGRGVLGLLSIHQSRSSSSCCGTQCPFCKGLLHYFLSSSWKAVGGVCLNNIL